MTGSFWPGYWTARGQASERNVPAATDFLSPAQQAMAMDMLRTAGISDTAYVRLGGYDDAERALLLFLPDWLDAADARRVKVPSRVCGAFRAVKS